MISALEITTLLTTCLLFLSPALAQDTAVRTPAPELGATPMPIPMGVLHPKNSNSTIVVPPKFPNLRKQMVTIVSNPNPRMPELAGIVIAITSVCDKAKTEMKQQVAELDNMFNSTNGLGIVKEFCNKHAAKILNFYKKEWQPDLIDLVKSMKNTTLLEGEQDKIMLAYQQAADDHNARLHRKKFRSSMAAYQTQQAEYEKNHKGYQPLQVVTNSAGDEVYAAASTMSVQSDGDVQARFGWWTTIEGWQTMGFPPIPPGYGEAQATNTAPAAAARTVEGTGSASSTASGFSWGSSSAGSAETSATDATKPTAAARPMAVPMPLI